MNTLAPMFGYVACLALIADAAQAEQLIPVPSGQPLTLGEVLIDDTQGEDWIRFRFVTPKIAKSKVSFDQSAPDMDYLCQHLAIPYLGEHRLKPARIIISFSDSFLEFGKSDPSVTQYFEAYRRENDSCIWEAF